MNTQTPSRPSLLWLLACVLPLGCALFKPVPEEPPYRMKLDYQPGQDPSDTTPTGFSAAVIQPATQDLAKEEDPDMKAFNAALTRGLVDVLQQRGLTVKGPVPDLSEMSFADKKATRFVVAPELRVTSDCKAQEGFKLSNDSNSSARYSLALGVKGELVVRILEPQSKEPLVQRRIELPGDSQQLELWSKGDPCGRKLGAYDAQMRNAVLRSLEKQYQVAIASVDKQLSRAELAELAEQAAEIKAKKAY